MVIFRDRAEAGRFLGNLLKQFRRNDDRGRKRGDEAIVLALPRGGVAVGEEVARSIGAPLDVLVVRKLGLPGHEELAMGAIAEGGVFVLNEEVVDSFNVPDPVIDRAVARASEELVRRVQVLRRGRPPLSIEGRTVILVDDGLATGSTMRAAIESARQRTPARIVVAVPIAAAQTVERLRRKVDELICADTPEDFFAVGSFYEDFRQLTEEEVREALDRIATGGPGAHPA